MKTNVNSDYKQRFLSSFALYAGNYLMVIPLASPIKLAQYSTLATVFMTLRQSCTYLLLWENKNSNKGSHTVSLKPSQTKNYRNEIKLHCKPQVSTSTSGHMAKVLS